MSIIYFIFVLGITVFVHELGHFICAKKSLIYVYEFSIGMGPRLFKFKRKNDETVYSIRIFPIGGFVQMAGEEVEVDKKIPKNMRLQEKTWFQKALTISAGVLFNFIFAFILLFIVGIINGSNFGTTNVESVVETLPAYSAGLKENDKIIKINGKRVNTSDILILELQANSGKSITLTVNRDNTIKDINITPKKVKVDGVENYQYGFSLVTKSEKGVISAIKYAGYKFGSLMLQMVLIIKYLIIGKLKLNSLSGPVGIFNIVSESAKAGFINLIYLIAYLCVNIGFINIIPLPAFDGGRLLFLIIEKIKGSPINPKVENAIHNIGFILLMILMVLITYNDIMRLIKR